MLAVGYRVGKCVDAAIPVVINEIRGFPLRVVAIAHGTASYDVPLAKRLSAWEMKDMETELPLPQI